jgi:hypothetical protein
MENKKEWWEQATIGDQNKDSDGNKMKWYNQQSKLWWSIIIWPVGIYGVYKTDLIKKEYKIALLVLCLLGGIAAELFG